ncbi:MAG: response regulator [Deltaproteobacteria bacterium]|nr:response regulator [Deltaproteobacteria bacterium]
MSDKEILKGKKILAVDDEQDVLSVIREELEACQLITAGDFDSARQYLKREPFDLVILDIMGVKGFDLLDIARSQRLPAVMLTAHAMTPNSFQKSIDKGAVSFLPKDELYRLDELIMEILEELGKGETHWYRLIERLGPRFKELWGQLWEEIKFPPESKITW